MKQNIKLAKETQKNNRLKRILDNIDYGEALIVSLAIGFIIGAILGFVEISQRPMDAWLDTPFSRFLEFVLYTLGGGTAGAGAVFFILILVGCFVVIAHFIISILRG